MGFWCSFHIFCIHISRVDFPARICAKVYSSMNTCSYSRSLCLSLSKNREEWHPNSEIVSTSKVFFSLDIIHRNLSQIVHQTEIFLGHRGNCYDKEFKKLINKEVNN